MASIDPQATHAEALPGELIAAIGDVYLPAGLQVTKAPSREAESSEYGAARFSLDGRSIVFRVAKTTPTKVGQFVTLWKRPAPDSVIAPLDIEDGIDVVVVSVCSESQRGQFVFDRTILLAKGVMAVNGKGGKRAFRVYPPWVKTVAAQAVKTQQWQLRYFLSFAEDGRAGCAMVRRLFQV